MNVNYIIKGIYKDEIGYNHNYTYSKSIATEDEALNIIYKLRRICDFYYMYAIKETYYEEKDIYETEVIYNNSLIDTRYPFVIENFHYIRGIIQKDGDLLPLRCNIPFKKLKDAMEEVKILREELDPIIIYVDKWNYLSHKTSTCRVIYHEDNTEKLDQTKALKKPKYLY